jgi:phosphoglycerate dehydrogenase-like enzyme
MARKKGIYILDSPHWDNIYGPEERAELARLVDITAPMQTRESVLADPSLVRDIDVIFSGWGAPVFNREFLEAAPKLKAVFYASGTVKGFVTVEFWERGIELSGANSVFVIPVVEYTISQILFCLKHGWQFASETRRLRTYAPHRPVPGAFGSTVGLISLGAIARRVRELLRPYDLKVIAYDPFASKADAEKLGITLCSLEEIFAQADVISVHAPQLPETEKMLRAEHFSAMKEGASFINTARGAVVDEAALAEVFAKRPDLVAVLDVTWPEPPPPESPLYDLPNVIITPHIAGCMSLECRRGGRFVAEELGRYLRGEPLQGRITQEKLAFIA